MKASCPFAPNPFETAQDKVADAWTAEQTLKQLTEQAEALVPELEETGDFTATGLPFRVENSMTRTAFVDGTPADFMSQVFEMEKGEVRVIRGDGVALIVQVTDMLPPEDNQELVAMQTALGSGLDQSLSEALFQVYMRDAQLRARPQIDQNALNAVLTSFQ